MQRNWLGKSVKFKLKFPTIIPYETPHADPQKQVSGTTQIIVETKRADVLHGVQYLALSARHPIVVNLARYNTELKLFLDSVPSLPADSNAGFLLPQTYAYNPIAKLPKPPAHVCQPLPVYVARYISDSDEKLAVMGVPGHDVRDCAFWNEHHNGDRIFKVITPDGLRELENGGGPPVVQPGALNSLCGTFAGLHSSEAAPQIVLQLQKIKLATWTEDWRLHDWLISRQRYWGTPIPVIFCRKCGPLPVPADQLPVKLPKLEGNWFKGKTGNPLDNADDWVNVTCHKCDGPAKRETDTMDTFMDSSWYFMRYVDPGNMYKPFSPHMADRWLPVDIYVGGVEHAILHLLYARFVCKFLATNGSWPLGDGKKAEPFQKLITQGMVHGKTFSDPETGRFLKPEEVDISDPSTPKMANNATVANVSWEKMSKSKHNGVDPMECIKKYGADVTRAHILFQAPVTEVLEWDEEKIIGVQRWFGRIWRLTQDVGRQLTPAVPQEQAQPTQTGINRATTTSPLVYPPQYSLAGPERHLWTQVQKSIISVRSSLYDTFTLNTVISDLMELTKTLISTFEVVKPMQNFHGLSVLLRMLAPIAPAFAEECWESLHASIPEIQRSPDTPVAKSIFDAPFPESDQSSNSVSRPPQKCIVQENGKKRLILDIPAAPLPLLEVGKEAHLREWLLDQIRETGEGRQWLARAREQKKKWSQIIVAKGGKIVNFVEKKSRVRTMRP